MNEIKHAKKALAVLLVGAALLLSGCTTANSAAKVGKTNISESVIENRVAAIIQERKGVDTSQMQLTTGNAHRSLPKSVAKRICLKHLLA